ncbi:MULTISPECIES: FAD-dependent oxidoreductase [Chromohalobacter]|uniref:FAD dependent oxidoreductase n=1 Tax=Chromohalobacter israelensis (strain ATCC BAA-138 / DSM 3043 / CIP 106854 / NCIMB 13768 / 1H11) TaxID=290398 RepID=Q1QWT2_CHRI1|nr:MULTISPECIES: FAD-dependent oxidoreductase [Chromohalobacter]ABE59076.1 FAD dependent oxidoreductase [Chromohalobacter salexigens DSM 3043]NQY44313.1 FAD-binding oxidoreductase [Chromohalobacter sp.]
MTHDTLVLGAGMVGVGVAYHLARRGRRVALLDRREPGRETSYGNAGIIQREAVAPHAFPRELGELWRVLGNRGVDVRYTPRGIAQAGRALWQYWQHSAPEAYARIVPEYASLIALSIDAHAEMIEAAGAEALIRRDGWLEVYRTPAALEARQAEAQALAERFGLTFDALDATALRAREPHLDAQALGAVHWRDPWTAADPGALVAAYARAFEAAGGECLRGDIRDIARHGEGWRVTTAEGAFEARDVVLALGPWADHWLGTLGYRLPLFVKRGYHMHYAPREQAPLHHWLLDAETGYLLSPMQAGIRLTTGAELAPRDAPPGHAQLEAAERVARGLFPLGERLESRPWKGARPCTPDMKPIIGPAPRHAGLWFALGHAHQGFTLGPATGQLLAAMMAGEVPAIDMAPFRAERFL